MKLLLACVNSSFSLIGFDWNRGEIFWALPSSILRVCGACYRGAELWIASDNKVTALSSRGARTVDLVCDNPPLLHSIHPAEDGLVGVTDTGNSRVLFLTHEGQVRSSLSPLSMWREYPADAIHLNDFAFTPYGILASCFGYRPWRKMEASLGQQWHSGNYGLVLNLSGSDGKGSGRVVGCGFTQPHSLHYSESRLYLCSAGAGIFHICELDEYGILRERSRHQISVTHFLRGALRWDSNWFLGGSSLRRGQSTKQGAELYLLGERSGLVSKKSLGWVGEIYDILPWHEEILEPLIESCFQRVEETGSAGSQH